MIKNRNKWILDQCSGKTVLHIGCTDWPITKKRIQEGGLLHSDLVKVCDCVGVDQDMEGIALMRETMPSSEFIACNVEELKGSNALGSRMFDVVLAADVIEHVSNLGNFLKSLASCLSSDGRLLVTTPSAFSIKRFLGMLCLGIENVHQDHCYYFSESTLKQILGRYSLKIASAKYFQWRNPTTKNRVANMISQPFLLASRGRLGDELAVVAEHCH